MAIYAKVESGVLKKYPYGFLDLKADNPSTSFPVGALSDSSIRSLYNVVEVVEVEKPVKAGWKSVEESPTLGNGVWTQNWNHSIKSIDELIDGDVKAVEEPSGQWLNENDKKVSEGAPEIVDGEWTQVWVTADRTWLENRIAAYEGVDDQIEFITENSLEAWQTKVAEIKAKYPKS
tara:strand:- start:6 stop:533 length:528 start_codon:yes stop_codon:yes gene_type:complete